MGSGGPQKKRREFLLKEYEMLSNYLGNAIGLRFAIFGAFITAAVIFLRLFARKDIAPQLEIVCAFCVSLIPIVLTFVISALSRISYLYSFRMKQIAEEFHVYDCFWAIWSKHAMISNSEIGTVPSKHILLLLTYSNFLLISAYFLNRDIQDQNVQLYIIVPAGMVIVTILTRLLISFKLNVARMNNLKETWNKAKKLNKILSFGKVDILPSYFSRTTYSDYRLKEFFDFTFRRLEFEQNLGRRKFPRMPIRLPVAYACNDGGTINGKLNNISAEGACIEAMERADGEKCICELKEGNGGNITFHLPKSDMNTVVGGIDIIRPTPEDMFGKIMWIKNNAIGVSFYD